MIENYEEKLIRAKKKVSTRVKKNPKVLPLGSLWKHPKTGGYYWRYKGKNTPLVPAGKRYATKSRPVAIAIAKMLIDEIQKNPPLDFEKLLDGFATSNSLRAKPNQVDRNRKKLTRFFKFADVPPSQVSTQKIEEFLSEMGQKFAHSTVIEYFHTISAFYKWACKRDTGIEYNPADAIELAPPVKRPPVLIRRESIDLLFSRIERDAPDDYKEDLHLAVRVAVHGGLRLSEIINLRKGAVVQQDNSWSIIVGEYTPTKSGSWRIAPIPDDLAADIRSRPIQDDELVFRPVIDWTWCDRLRKLTEGIQGFGTRGKRSTGNRWHALRAFCATEKAKTYPLYRLMYEMGWRHPETAQRYIDVARAARGM